MAHQQVNPVTRFCKQNELTKLSEDQCYLDRRDYDSRKPFKWRTYHHHPYGCKVQSTCYPGQFYKDGYGIGGCNVDDDSRVNRNPGWQMTNPNVHQELPTLPINLPHIRGWHDADTESSLRWEANFNNKPCLADTTIETSFNSKTFQIFDHLCYNPQEVEYIVPEDTFNKCFKGARFYKFGGEDTRHDRVGKYRSGCDWSAKYTPLTLSYSYFGY